jgi:CRISPR/Cas system-associated exonuclease Cas4 (RecB family)
VAVETAFSASSIKTFLRCPQQWAFAHLEKIRMPPSIKMVLGTAAHAGVEHNYTQKLKSFMDLPELDVLDAYSTSFDTEVQEVEKPDEDAGKAKDQGATLVSIYQNRVAPQVQPLWVERNTTFRVISQHEEDCPGGECSCGVPFSATVDLIDEARQVRELKTTARTPSGGQHLMQVAAQAIGFEAETGEQASDLIVDTLIRKKVSDYHQERWGGPVDGHMKRTFAKQVTTAASMVKGGLFPATGAEAGPGGPCGWCGYKSICPVWKKNPRTGGAG